MFLEEVELSCLEERLVVLSIEGGTDSSMEPIRKYLKKGSLPEDKGEAMKLRRRAARFVLIMEQLYRRVFLRLAVTSSA